MASSPVRFVSVRAGALTAPCRASSEDKFLRPSRAAGMFAGVIVDLPTPFGELELAHTVRLPRRSARSTRSGA